MRKTIIIILIIILVGFGLYAVKIFNATAVVISNQGSAPLDNVKIEIGGSTVEVGTVLPSRSKTALIRNRFGESDIKIAYGEGGVWQGAYIENRNKINIIYNDDDIRYEIIPFCRFLFGI